MSIKTASSESILAPKTFLAYKITVLIWSPLVALSVSDKALKRARPRCCQSLENHERRIVGI
jgi:hypothetical protein